MNDFLRSIGIGTTADNGDWFYNNPFAAQQSIGQMGMGQFGPGLGYDRYMADRQLAEQMDLSERLVGDRMRMQDSLSARGFGAGGLGDLVNRYQDASTPCEPVTQPIIKGGPAWCGKPFLLPADRESRVPWFTLAAGVLLAAIWLCLK